jgi:hypothetical protein
MNNLAINKELPNNLLTIDQSAYFDVEKKQLHYEEKTTVPNGKWETEDFIPVNRYALVRKDTGQLLGIHSEDYVVRPYSVLAEKVNDVIREALPNYEEFEITTQDHVYANGRKYRRDINFWNKDIQIESFKHKGQQEKIIPQIRIYSSLDGQWGQQIMFSSMYMWCMNGMVRPDWTFTVYNKHSSRKDIAYSVSEFRSGLQDHEDLGNEMFKMLQRKVNTSDVTELFRKTLAAKPYKKGLDIEHDSILVLNHLDNLWCKYNDRYGSTLFAVYQTATDWATHPITRGSVYNVSRKREKAVANMLSSKQWEGMYGH